MSSKTWIATGRNVPSHRRSVVFTLVSGMCGRSPALINARSSDKTCSG